MGIDLGTPEGTALVLMLVAGVAKWRLPDLRGSLTAALIVVGGIAMCLAHTIAVLGDSTPMAIELAIKTGLVGAATAMGVASAVRGSPKNAAPE
jgi:hypothetical protein